MGIKKASARNFNNTDNRFNSGNLPLILPPPSPGQITYTTEGTYTFTVPLRITSVSVVCIGAGGAGNFPGGGGGGGGALAYGNSIAVTPGASYQVVVGTGGTLGVAGGDSYFNAAPILNAGGGGFGTAGNGQASGGGGGAGGYSGTGGAGGSAGNSAWAGGSGGVGSGTARTGGGTGGAGGNGSSTPQGNVPGGSAGSGGAGSGGSATPGDFMGGSGGGVGLLGQGPSGTAPSAISLNVQQPVANTEGKAGSGGSPGTQIAPNPPGWGNYGGAYGGGSASKAVSPTQTVKGSPGAVRIMWPGTDRQYPNTRVADE